MERIVELRGLEGVYCSDVVHAYMSCNAEDVQKAKMKILPACKTRHITWARI